METMGPLEALILLLAIGLVLWLLVGAARRQGKRECPACGRYEKRGNLKCSGCGYGFRRSVR